MLLVFLAVTFNAYFTKRIAYQSFELVVMSGLLCLERVHCVKKLFEQVVFKIVSDSTIFLLYLLLPCYSYSYTLQNIGCMHLCLCEMG